MPYIGTSPSNGVRRVHTYTATASQTTFSGASSEGVTLSYVDTNYLDVYQNGILLGSADYTATSGTSIVLAQAASASDLVVIVVYDVFSVADTVSKANGGTFDNGITIDADGATVLTVDRATSDGAIIDLQKGGTSVGKIGNAATDDFYIGATTANHSGLYFGTNIVYPMTANSLSDGATSLGHSSNRFNNLYLSGGVYLGGTGSANKLDDYEEGTWTPTMGGTTTYYARTGEYTKVGDIVFVRGQVSINAIGTGSTATIGGLPFTSKTTVNGNPAGVLGISYYSGLAIAVNYISGYVTSADTNIQISANAGNNTTVQYNTGNFFGNGTRLDFSMVYQVA